MHKYANYEYKKQSIACYLAENLPWTLVARLAKFNKLGLILV
jgi:hypothetical protein